MVTHLDASEVQACIVFSQHLAQTVVSIVRPDQLSGSNVVVPCCKLSCM